jgi:phosphoribosylanthranilate isomerase
MREEDIAAANELFPDYVSFVFWPDNRHYITPERALELKDALDEDITVVGVFANAPMRFVAALLNENLLDIAQLNGDEDDAYIESLRSSLRAPEEKAIVKAFSIAEEADVQAARESSADMVLLDTGLESGSGFDWGLISDFDRPYFLSGGLDPRNIGDALSQTGAAYVDTSEGVETDGRKDPAKMLAFIQAVHAWDDANPRLSFLESLHPEYHEE